MIQIAKSGDIHNIHTYKGAKCRSPCGNENHNAFETFSKKFAFSAAHSFDLTLSSFEIINSVGYTQPELSEVI